MKINNRGSGNKDCPGWKKSKIDKDLF